MMQVNSGADAVTPLYVSCSAAPKLPVCGGCSGTGSVKLFARAPGALAASGGIGS